MSPTSVCPQCQEEVSIPDGLEAQSVVRCPLCSSQFPLAEAIGESVIPPMLEPVSPPEEIVLPPVDDDELAENGEPQEVGPWGEETSETADEDSQSHAESYDFGEHAPPNYSPAATAVLRREEAKSSAAGHLGKFVGMALAGLLGITFAYFVLSLVSPRHFDFLNLWGRRTNQTEKQPAAAESRPKPAPKAEPDDKSHWPGFE
jgi:hypothetical protein